MAKTSMLELIAVVQVDGKLVNIETISIQASGAVLSGAWTINKTELEKISDILEGKYVFAINPEAQDFVAKVPKLKFPTFNDFILEAKTSAEKTQEAFNEYVESDPKKRKTLVTPDLYVWPDSVELSESVEVLKMLGGQQVPANTPEEFITTLAASMVIRFYLNAWLRDESERVSRAYLNSSPSFVRLVPDSRGN